jgi:zinc protease
MRWRCPVALVLVAAIVASASAARAATPVLETTLDNGLRVLILEDRRNPLVSVQLWYRVGSRNERPGATGLAHFLEHMMFKGTPMHPKGAYSRAVEGNGGHDNAFTTQDTTSYFVNIAADKVDEVLQLEADRMRNLLLDPAEIDAERQVVMEERRMRTEDSPDGLLAEEVMATAFEAHPYGWPVIGWMEDIARINPAELRAFYDLYYRPNNAVLVVVGDVRPPELLARVRTLFGPIPRGPEPPPVTAVEPPPRAERRVTLRSVAARLPALTLTWLVPNFRSPDAPALEVLETVLSDGRASRLHRRLVVEMGLALDADADYSYGSVDPNLFWLSARPAEGADLGALERGLLDEMERLKREPIDAEELARAQNQIEASFVWGQDSIYSRAATLARFERMGSWRRADEYVAAIRAVTAADVQRAARTYFPADVKTVGVLLPESSAHPPGGPENTEKEK